MMAGVVGGATFCAAAWVTHKKAKVTARTGVSKARMREVVPPDLKIL
jgi:hypothetical protein